MSAVAGASLLLASCGADHSVSSSTAGNSGTAKGAIAPAPGVAPAAEVGSGPLQAARTAWAASLNTLRTIATAVVVVLVYSWWIAPIVLVMGWLALRQFRRDREQIHNVNSSDTAAR